MPNEPLRAAPAGVTIAIASWNQELLLPRAVASALAGIQALASISIPGEVLVVDDYSRDGTRTMLLQLEALYYHQGLRIALQDSRGGASATRNQALRQATYRYLLYLDADNKLSPDALPLLYRAIVDTRAAMVYGNLIAHQPDGAILMSNESMQGRLFTDPYIDTCALWDSVQIDDVGGFEEGQVIPEDMELILHLVTNGRQLVFVPIVVGHHFQYAGSWMTVIAQQNPAYLLQMQRVFNQLGRREQMQSNSDFLRYHPDLGYL